MLQQAEAYGGQLGLLFRAELVPALTHLHRPHDQLERLSDLSLPTEGTASQLALAALHRGQDTIAQAIWAEGTAWQLDKGPDAGLLLYAHALDQGGSAAKLAVLQ